MKKHLYIAGCSGTSYCMLTVTSADVYPDYKNDPIATTKTLFRSLDLFCLNIILSTNTPSPHTHTNTNTHIRFTRCSVQNGQNTKGPQLQTVCSAASQNKTKENATKNAACGCTTNFICLCLSHNCP